MVIAEDLNLTNTQLDSDEIDAAMGLIVGTLRSLPVADAAVRSARYQSWLAAVEAEMFARNKASGASDRDNEKLAGRGSKTSKAEAKRKAKRGAAVDANPNLAGDLASGELGTEQIDAIANAASSGELIGKIKNAAPDDAGKIAKNWVEEHNNRTDDESKNAADRRRDRQRRLRGASRFDTDNDLAAILLTGDTESIDAVWEDLSKKSRKLWAKDGGRDLPAGQHPRTRKQRLFDAACQSISGAGSSSGPASSPTASSGALIHMWVQLDDVVAGNPTARFADGSLVPQAVLSRYMCSGSIAGTVFDAQGEVIHHGREHRYATPAQIRGLIARDKGCVLCSASASECEAHHLIPWNAPLSGETNIDEMALVCTDCHHFIHNTLQTLYRNAKGLWCLRLATADETPPAGRPRNERNSMSNQAGHGVRHE